MMSYMMAGGRGLATKAARNYKSCLLVSLNDSGIIKTRHPLDTNIDEYKRVTKDIIIPDCMEMAPDIKGYSERVNKLLNYVHPAFNDCWNFGVELTYRTIIPEEHQTKEDLTKVRILRACMDLAFTMTAVVDDIADDADFRRNKPAWYKICEGGIWAGLYDGTIMCFMPFYILQRHFKDDPGYTAMLEIFMNGFLKMLIGELVDVLGHRGELTDEAQKNIIGYKAGHFVAMQGPLGLLHSGINDKALLQQAYDIYYRMGTLIQTWDDFNDYYSPPSVTGKPACDLQNAGTTWATVTAIKQFNPDQMRRFKESFGSKDEGKLDEVKRLFDEVDLPGLYVAWMRKQYREISALISQVSHSKFRQACTIYLDWLIGDLAP